MDYKIGFSKDIHLVSKTDHESELSLGGYKFLSNIKIIAHSDGDIIIHAIADAIFDALNIEDIGYYFKDTDESIKGISSLEILDFAIKKVKEFNYKVKQISLTVFSNDIYIQKVKLEILNKLKNILQIESINLKGKTFEQENNTIECYCNLLLISNR